MTSLAVHPSVTDDVTAYAASALAVPGATAAAAKNLRAAIFEPRVVTRVEPELSALVASLVEAVNGRHTEG